MKEIRDILRKAETLQEGEVSMVLATLVHLEGSSYRRPGARMLVSQYGVLTGAISGGCLEGDALQKALTVLHHGKPRIVTYDTMDEEDPFGVGLGCNGILQVLMEPVRNEDASSPIGLLRRIIAERKHSVLATLYSLEDRKGPQPGTCLLLDGDGVWTGSLPDKELEESVRADMEKTLPTMRSSFLRYRTSSGPINAFLEYIPPPVALVVVGAGNDALPLVNLSESLGWETTVVDGRGSHASRERFGSGCRVMVSRPEEVLEQTEPDRRTAFVLMSHNYEYDKAVMRTLLQKEFGYLGMLGPKRKFERMIEELRREGETVTPDVLERLYAPVGLNIGAEGPGEIAVSIIAGICAALSDSPGTPLRNLKGAIHPEDATRFIERKIR